MSILRKLAGLAGEDKNSGANRVEQSKVTDGCDYENQEHCNQCGSVIFESDKFCGGCGEKITGVKAKDNNFNIINEAVRQALRHILKDLKINLQNNDFETFSNIKFVNPIYYQFEVFIYLLFQVDCCFIAMHQEHKIREALFAFMADDMLNALCLSNRKINIFNRMFNLIINQRMIQYGDIQTNKNLTDDLRQINLIKAFLENLIYAISKRKFFNWNKNAQQFTINSDTDRTLIRIIYKESFLLLELKFRNIIKNILIVNSDFTKLSARELDDYIERNTKENDCGFEFMNMLKKLAGFEYEK